jgi:ComF family protein
MFSKIYDSILTLTYPQTCKICEKSVENSADGIVCEDCWEKTRIFIGNEILCRKCGAFLKEQTANFNTNCQRCTEDFYDQAKSCGIYENGFLTTILNLKHTPFLPKKVENILLQTFESTEFSSATRIISVPLSRERFTERGFNQSSIIGESLAKKTNIVFDDLSLVRTLHSEKNRAGMDRKARAESVKNAFEVKRPKLVENEIILLVDDVFTTGATVSNCAKILKKKGASKVYVLTLARAV